MTRGAQEKRAPTIARCEKCGRGFVTIPKAGQRDAYLPANEPATWKLSKPCGGLIVPIEQRDEEPPT